LAIKWKRSVAKIAFDLCGPKNAFPSIVEFPPGAWVAVVSHDHANFRVIVNSAFAEERLNQIQDFS
jgi:hypothetical protein